jgi:NTP pyrophosphatase (non-canonical NTP hydrolase)
MVKFSRKNSLDHFQKMVQEMYGLPDDRLFSLWDLISNQERFTMRALKGIRKGKTDKLKKNLLISFSWLMAVANRLHINAEDAVWKRFPAKCSYCGSGSCQCKTVKAAKKPKFFRDVANRPGTLAGVQKMFRLIYPPESRNLFEAGVHLAEEMGELSEAVHCFLGEHQKKQFQQIEVELADYISCIFGVANSAKIDVAKELEKFYWKNCHDCHKSPCECNFTTVAKFES